MSLGGTAITTFGILLLHLYFVLSVPCSSPWISVNYIDDDNESTL